MGGNSTLGRMLATIAVSTLALSMAPFGERLALRFRPPPMPLPIDVEDGPAAKEEPHPPAVAAVLRLVCCLWEDAPRGPAWRPDAWRCALSPTGEFGSVLDLQVRGQAAGGKHLSKWGDSGQQGAWRCALRPTGELGSVLDLQRRGQAGEQSVSTLASRGIELCVEPQGGNGLCL